MATKKDFHKVVIGRFELMKLVDYDSEVPAKVDTGAYRSSIHAVDITENPDGTISFKLLKGHDRSGGVIIPMRVSKFSIANITNSFGHQEDRFEVKLKVKIGPRVFQGSFTLADRSKNIFPILIGRKILNDRFIVDTSYSALDRAELKRSLGIEMPDDEDNEAGVSE